MGNLNPFRYRGYYYDTESKLYYLMSRYYDPVTHRFINADGYYQSGGGLLDTNMNAYCGNNPVNNVDPNGTCYLGSKWMVMGPVPGASYYCYKCGGCDPAVYPNAPKGSSSPSKKKPSTIEQTTMPNTAVAYGSMTGTTKSGWYWRIDSENTSTLTQRHIVIQKGKFKYAQNFDGKPHDGSQGSPPNTVKKELKEKGIWDWDAKDAEWKSKHIDLNDYYANDPIMYFYFYGGTFSPHFSPSPIPSPMVPAFP